jgi:hypothetical protein
MNPRPISAAHVGRWIMVALSLLAPVGIYFSGRDAMGRIETWRLDRLCALVPGYVAIGNRATAWDQLFRQHDRIVQAHHGPGLRWLAVLAARDQPQASTDYYEQLIACDQATWEDRAELALLRLRTGKRARGLTELELLAKQRPPDVALHTWMVQATNLPVPELQHLQHLGPLSYREPPSRAGDLLRGLEQAMQQSAPRDQVGITLQQHEASGLRLTPRDFERVARWLLHHGFPEHAADILPDALLLDDDAVLALKVDALVRAGQFAPAEALIINAGPHLPEATSYLLSAVVHTQRPTFGLRLELEHCLHISQRDGYLGHLVVIASLAHEARLHDLALRVLDLQFEVGLWAEGSLQRYLVAARHQGLSAGETLNRLRTYPVLGWGNIESEQGLAYLTLLVGEGLELMPAAVARWDRVAGVSPDSQLLSAMHAYRVGNGEAAIRCLTVDRPANAWSAGQLASLIGLMHDLGQHEFLQEVRPQVQRAALFPEERAWLERDTQGAE